MSQFQEDRIAPSIAAIEDMGRWDSGKGKGCVTTLLVSMETGFFPLSGSICYWKMTEK